MTSDPARRASPADRPELDPGQRKSFRSQAHHLDPVVTIGDAGLSEAVIAETDRALDAHGLIKIRVHGDDRARRLDYLEQICTRLACAPVQTIGKLLVVWRPIPPQTGGGNAGLAARSRARTTKKTLGARGESAGSGSLTRSARPGSGTRARRREPGIR